MRVIIIVKQEKYADIFNKEDVHSLKMSVGQATGKQVLLRRSLNVIHVEKTLEPKKL